MNISNKKKIISNILQILNWAEYTEVKKIIVIL